MESALEKLTEHIKNKKYDKILQVIGRIDKHGDDSKSDVVHAAYQEQLCILKMIIINDMQTLLCNGREIPPVIWALIDLLGRDFMMNVGVVSVSFVLSRYAEEFRSKASEIRSIGDMPRHLSWAEKRVREAAAVYNDLPDDWCLHDMLVLLFCRETARVLEEDNAGVSGSNEMWVEATKACVDFETRYTRSARCICSHSGCAVSVKKPGNTVITFLGEGVEVDAAQTSGLDSPQTALGGIPGKAEEPECLCKSRKSISKVLSKNLVPYAKYLCSDLSCIEFDQEDHEMCIIRCFIAFFSILGRAHARIVYFEENTCYDVFIAKCDQHLCEYLEKLRVAVEYNRGVIVANSLVFVESTLGDFLRNKAAFAKDEHRKWKSFDRIRMLEAAQLDLLGRSVEKVVMEIKLDIDGFFGRHFVQTLLATVFAVDTVYIYPELITFVLSASLSVLLFRISEVKMSVCRAEHILGEIGEIKSGLSHFKHKTSAFSTLETYLKVYLVPPEDVENFVQNFLLLSESKFVFTQILKRLENSSNNAKLYMCYKSKVTHG